MKMQLAPNTGMRTTDWSVTSSAIYSIDEVTYIDARFRDRWGNRWTYRMVTLNELIEDAGPALRMWLELTWNEFKRIMHRRYDDPFAFWPRMYPGRWAKPPGPVSDSVDVSLFGEDR
jgi:hypothetical protein